MRNFQPNKYHFLREWDWTPNFWWIIGRVVAVLLFLMLCQQRLKAQQTAVFSNEINYLNRGLELFDKEKYAAAQQEFEHLASVARNPEDKIKAEYYAAVCAMELFNPDAEVRLRNIIAKYPEHTRSRLATYQLGRWNYRNKNNKQAVQWLDRTDATFLSGPELKEYYFIYGYSLFKMERYADAKKSFANIKDEKSKYYDATNYYYGYVCYQSGAYDEALEHFGRVKYHKTFGPLSMVYVAQVYFSRKQYKEVIAYCDTISNKEVANDVAGMLGQSHYLLGQFKDAIPHMEKFLSDAPVMPGRNDYYMLAYALEQTENYKKATESYLKMDVKTGDTLYPYQQYHLGICYLKEDAKPTSRAAFDNAWQTDSTGKLAEPSLFFSAKIADELNQQSAAMQRYLKVVNNFPEGTYAEEAKSNLSQLLLNTRNYKDAVRILEGLKNPGKADKINLHRVVYYRAEELYLNNQYAEADAFFDRAAGMEDDPRISGLANFWLAEQDYREQQYREAVDHLKKFQQSAESKESRYYNSSFYNLGYGLLKLKEYITATEAFSQYLQLEKTPSNIEIYTDALVRTADCYFAAKSYDKAVDTYTILIQKELNGADYALYQKAMILGVLGKNEEKLKCLRTLEKSYPKSPYIDDAVYELADIHLKSENYTQAIEAFQSILTNYPRSIYLRKSMLNKALALFNLRRDQEALEEIKKLITNYPGSEEAREALPMVQNIFVNQGKGEEYLEFVKVLPNVVVSASTQDSLSYESAFNLYQKENWEKASKGFGNYINRFPGGYFILKANYFKAESDYRLKKYDDALVGYEYVANSLRSDYSERATRQTAVLYNLRKNYDKAYEYFAALERIASNRENLQLSMLGQMRAAAYQSKGDTAAQTALRYLASGIGQKEGLTEANLYAGRYYLNRNQNDSAQAFFSAVLKESKTIYGAEAKYGMAMIQYRKKEYKSAQKTLFELSEKFSAFETWVARGFVLLADTYIRQADYFQAKATLQSLIDNYDGADILAECKLRLNEIAELEASQKAESKKQIENRIRQSEK